MSITKEWPASGAKRENAAMNTRDLEYLVAVAEELHFGRAAERCNASQPALSGQLRKLEERLGVKVFERTKRYVRLTAIGERIVDRARDILREVDEMEKIAAAHRDPLVGACALGMPPTVCPYLTPFAATGHEAPAARGGPGVGRGLHRQPGTAAGRRPPRPRHPRHDPDPREPLGSHPVRRTLLGCGSR